MRYKTAQISSPIRRLLLPAAAPGLVGGVQEEGVREVGIIVIIIVLDAHPQPARALRPSRSLRAIVALAASILPRLYAHLVARDEEGGGESRGPVGMGESQVDSLGSS